MCKVHAGTKVRVHFTVVSLWTSSRHRPPADTDEVVSAGNPNPNPVRLVSSGVHGGKFVA